MFNIAIEGCGSARRVRPFLKWAGSKTRLLDTLRPYFPSGNYRFIEPFVGSGAVFLNLGYDRNLLADANPDLIRCFALLKADAPPFIASCEKLFTKAANSAEYYYRMRSEFNSSGDPDRRAVLFVYLNRHCFNGLCRYNQLGAFNTPFGKYDRPYFPRAEMELFSRRLANAVISVSDFRETLSAAGAGDLVYCDPPYCPLSSTAKFSSYSTGGFSSKDQRDLALACESASARGARIIVSNHDTPEARQLYQQADQIAVASAPRTISCKALGRNATKELVVTYKGKGRH